MGGQDGIFEQLTNCILEIFDQVAQQNLDVIINLNIHNEGKRVKFSKFDTVNSRIWEQYIREGTDAARSASLLHINS